MKKRNDIIIEDVLYYATQNEKANLLAEKTFYYTFLMEKASESIQGQNNRKAAEDFLIYERLYFYLLEKGYLTDENYLMDRVDLPEGMCFTFNLSKLMEKVNIEEELMSAFDGKHFEEYIKTLCHPADGLRCDFCGAITLSRHICFDGKTTQCLSCYPMSEDTQGKIKSKYQKTDCVEAVNYRLKLINDASSPAIADDKTTIQLIKEYVESQKTDFEDFRVAPIRKILKEAGKTEYEVITSEDFGIIVWNREALYDYDNFAKVFITSDDGKEIRLLYNVEDLCYVNDSAIDFVKRFTDKSLIELLK